MTFKQWINEPAYPLPFVINEEGYQEPAVNNVGISRLEYYVCKHATHDDAFFVATSRLAQMWKIETGIKVEEKELRKIIYGT